MKPGNPVMCSCACAFRFLACASLLLASATATISLAAETAPAAGNLKHTYVIVHGAWAGGWEHRKVGDLLADHGHIVYRPTLTGQGERVHLASPDIDLDTHILDVVNVILWEELEDFVLVRHSYGGMVITGVVDQLADRIKHVIYLDAFLPEDGESLYTVGGRSGRERPTTNGFVPLGSNNDNDNTDRPPPHTVPQSAKTFTQPIKLRNQEAAQRVPTSYILTVDEGRQPEQDGFFSSYERARARGWNVSIMTGSHIVHVTQPEEVVKRLEAIP